MIGKFTKKYNSIENEIEIEISFSNYLVALNLKEKWIRINY